MFDIGWSELLLVGIVALIVVGPRDLPGMFRTLGRFTAKARSMGREFQRAMDDAARESGAKDVASDLKAMTSKKNLGLDALDQAAEKFESWKPSLKPAAAKPAAAAQGGAKSGTAAQGGAKTGTAAQGGAKPATAAAAEPAGAAAKGPATRALAEKRAAEAAARKAAPKAPAGTAAKAPAKTAVQTKAKTRTATAAADKPAARAATRPRAKKSDA